MIRSAFLLIFVATSFAQTNKTVFPTELATQEGNQALALFTGLVPEYQELFRVRSLRAFGDTSVNITGLSLRVNGVSGSMDAVVPRFEIRVSTTSRTPENMSKFYSVNVGPDELLVYAHDNIHLVSTDAPSPRPFDLKFPFDQPFSYDPKAGNLLIDLRHTDGIGPLASSVDAHGYPTFGESPVGSFFTSSVGPDSSGVVLQFDWVAIPEPGVWALLGLGSLLFIARKHATERI